ncbi:glycoside hydrolase family 88 protein [Niabella hibiscisoli]|uniref:glycoside hydrolase family 88 protein n=1 Tax=Niabella hibiscisoli TaxID=1825928 RepID=UPI001F0EB7D5|nr:glycoside hydrolase family 88 protein [Niabella hibiscisoli]MCH5718922.1 glycoside hydrolase family 88 protein [Niabella hibiscisoli]
MAVLIKENFAFADSQYQYMMKQVAPDKMPQSYDEKNKKSIAYQRTWWCTGFYPGALWYIFEQTGNPVIKKEAERALKVIEPNKTYTGNHDLGFMMYCSFGNAYRITKNESYKEIIIQSAAALASRYRPSAKVIQSWNTNQYFKGPVIIDNMMNLELLYWTSLNGGDKKYKDIAIAHSNTTLKHHFRPDFSSYHVIDYNMQTGDVLRKATWQGAADCSAWSRGQGWGLYGYVMMYRFSKDKRYLDHARKVAGFILNHPNLPKDKIPYWDFDAPYIPHAKRDASAAALIASALLELGQYTNGSEKESYISNAKDMIVSLSGEKYKAKLGENGGFLLKHSTGSLPSNSEVDVPLIYADYYYLEALKRYKDWYL